MSRREPDEELVQPSRRARKEQWLEYRVAQGRDRATLESWTKPELIAGRRDAEDDLDGDQVDEPQSAPSPVPATALEAVEAQLTRDGHTMHALAASARILARMADGAENAVQAATAARELRMTLAALAGMDSEFGSATERAETDESAPTRLDKVRARRAARKAQGAHS